MTWVHRAGVAELAGLKGLHRPRQSVKAHHEVLSDETHINQHAEGVEEDLATCLPCAPLKSIRHKHPVDQSTLHAVLRPKRIDDLYGDVCSCARAAHCRQEVVDFAQLQTKSSQNEHQQAQRIQDNHPRSIARQTFEDPLAFTRRPRWEEVFSFDHGPGVDAVDTPDLKNQQTRGLGQSTEECTRHTCPNAESDVRLAVVAEGVCRV